MELMLISVIVGVDLNIISFVDLLIDVFVDLGRDLRFVGNSSMQSVDPLCSTIIILAKVWKVKFI